MTSVWFEPAIDHRGGALSACRGLPFDVINQRPAQAKAILVPLEDFRPTQMAVGMRAVAAKREKLERRARSRKRLRRFVEKNPAPAVIGPDDAYYIIDRHHLSLALWQNDIEDAFVRVVGDLSHLPRGRFLDRMAKAGFLHAFDADGRSACPSRLPRSLDALDADIYRDLAWSVRRAGGFAKTGAPYAEFHWANLFRRQISADLVRHDFKRAHQIAMRIASGPAARAMPGRIRAD